jgi:N-acyl-D-amino-acid deacylase
MGRSMHEDDIEQLLQWEFANICSDGGYNGHPRGYGAFPRVLARYVRDRNTLALETAIAMMSSRAANTLGLTDRGLLQEGLKADLVLLDPDTIQDHATVENSQQISTGIQSVWVNGKLVLENGRVTGARPGLALKRPAL